MKTSILQSILARNKHTINDLILRQNILKVTLKSIINEISYISLTDNPMYFKACNAEKVRVLKEIQKNQKSLKQLAEIQKEIKIEIKRNDSRDSYLLMLAKRGD